MASKIERNEADLKQVRAAQRKWHREIAKRAEADIIDVMMHPEKYAWVIAKHGLKKPEILVQVDGSPHTVGTPHTEESMKEGPVAAKKSTNKGKKSGAAKKPAKKNGRKGAAKKPAKKAAASKKPAKKAAAAKKPAKKAAATKKPAKKAAAAKKPAKKAAAAKKPAKKAAAAKKQPKKLVCAYCEKHGLKGSKNHREKDCPAKAMHAKDQREAREALAEKDAKIAAERKKAREARKEAKEAEKAPSKKASKKAASKKAASKKAASAKAPSKKAASKKAPSKKAASAKAPSKKASKKSPSKKGVIEVSVPSAEAAKKTPAKKAPAKKAPAKKAPAKGGGRPPRLNYDLGVQLGVLEGPLPPNLIAHVDDKDLAAAYSGVLDLTQTDALKMAAKQAAEQAKAAAKRAKETMRAFEKAQKARKSGGSFAKFDPFRSRLGRSVRAKPLGVNLKGIAMNESSFASINPEAQARIETVTNAALANQISAKDAEAMVEQIRAEAQAEAYAAEPEGGEPAEGGGPDAEMNYQEQKQAVVAAHRLNEIDAKTAEEMILSIERKMAAARRGRR